MGGRRGGEEGGAGSGALDAQTLRAVNCAEFVESVDAVDASYFIAVSDAVADVA